MSERGGLAMKIGPYKKERFLLCSADAGPKSQRGWPCEAGIFFPGAKWVGAIRNCAERLGCDFTILTTGHGMVRPWEIIDSYDMHIDEFREETKAIWEERIPKVLENDQYDIIVFYAGGCPRKPMLEVLLPILKNMGVSLLTFGRPNMFDVGRMDDIVEALVRGTSFKEIRALLRKPERLEFHCACEQKHRGNGPRPEVRAVRSRPKRVLFDETGSPLHPMFIKGCVSSFGSAYQATVREVIRDSDAGLDRALFLRNVAKVIVGFKMTRQGPFKGVRFDGDIIDSKGQIERCWSAVGKGILELRAFLDRTNKSSRGRALLDVSAGNRKRIIGELRTLFVQLLPICSGKMTKGMVGASKVLFAVLPEVAQPVDNTQWKAVFRTNDYGEIIEHMSNEAADWELKTGKRLDECDPLFPATSIPAVYNVMAMKAR